ncbi:MAG: site-2 protease family protein [Spirochaetia bacterium]|nr:site-2 protease family protein [Spirochaetia bacterium]
MEIAMQLTVLIFAIIIHEVSHGYVAYLLGDNTAKAQGRLTLNPIPHIDPVWSILVPVILVFTRSPFLFGGAKPVPINPNNFRNPKRDMMLSSLAGPGSNITLAVLCAIILKLTLLIPALSSPGLLVFMKYGIIINVMLAALNLVPIPPLDGSKILAYFLPDRWAWKYMALEQYGMIIFMVLIFTGVLTYLVMPIQNSLLYLIGLIL